MPRSALAMSCRWFMQLLLPVNVYQLVHEKEQHLRLMMKMQAGHMGGGAMLTWHE